jgi:hypothetical protein
MNIRIVIGRNGEEDLVVLADRSSWTWGAWLNRTEQAVKAVRAALAENRITPDAQSAHGWLKQCGVTSREQFEDLERHLPQLRQPMSAANGRRCRKCSSRIWGKMALLTGLGSECRRGKNRARKAFRELRQLAAPTRRFELRKAVAA